MAIYSLVNVHKTNTDATINGNWVQDHIGTLETAIQAAIATETANSNKIDIAVVDSRGHRSVGEVISFNKRLDTRRIVGYYDKRG